jgi:hypothetical protein
MNAATDRFRPPAREGVLLLTDPTHLRPYRLVDKQGEYVDDPSASRSGHGGAGCLRPEVGSLRVTDIGIKMND